MSPLFRRGIDSVKPIQINVHRAAAALHNHPLKYPAPRVGRILSLPKITRTHFRWAKGQEQREYETNKDYLHPESSKLTVDFVLNSEKNRKTSHVMVEVTGAVRR